MHGWDAESWGLGRVCGGRIGPPASSGMCGSSRARKRGVGVVYPAWRGLRLGALTLLREWRGRGGARKPRADGLAHAEGTGGAGRGAWAGGQVSPGRRELGGRGRNALPVHLSARKGEEVGGSGYGGGGLTFGPLSVWRGRQCVEEGGKERGEEEAVWMCLKHTPRLFLSPLLSPFLYTPPPSPHRQGDQRSSRPPPFAQTDAQEGHRFSTGNASPTHVPRPAPARARKMRGRHAPLPFSMGDASPAHVSHPAPAHVRNRRDGVPTLVPSARETPAPQPTRLAPPLPTHARGGDGVYPSPLSTGDATRPACPRMQEEGRLSVGDASPHRPPLACQACRKPRAHHQSPLRGLSHRPQVYAPRHARATPGGGSVRLASAPSARGTLPQPPRLRAPPLPHIPDDAGGPMRPPQTRPSPRLSASHPHIGAGRTAYSPPRFTRHARGEMRARGRAAREEGYTEGGAVQPERGWRTEGWAHRSEGVKRRRQRALGCMQKGGCCKWGEATPGGAVCGRRAPFS
ncbi:hypothetical protein EDB83DRAFT_2325620 [Lactarius deliciosus]|nr:hypothetical protein EDB83DRAFT_2325620 [Lactarius deliciosus]